MLAMLIITMPHLHFSRPRTPTFALSPPSIICSTALHSQKTSGFSFRVCQIRAQSDASSSQFVKRIEQAWSISKQPRPLPCSSCDTNGYVECKWCRGTGFFILGDNMLCEIPSRNTACLICAGQGSVHCSDCKGTGFRAKWLGQPPIVTAESEPA